MPSTIDALSEMLYAEKERAKKAEALNAEMLEALLIEEICFSVGYNRHAVERLTELGLSPPLLAGDLQAWRTDKRRAAIAKAEGRS